ncbi:MAG: hypothetical protein DLM73_12290 [Chthoniobacterales bacterium]|nr:MAG: hypothetical protein DLM73_12290 [Chthoniobacterales bacterium]
MKLCFILFGCLVVCAASAAEPPLTQEWLQKNYFESISGESDQLVVKFRSTGERFYCAGGARPDKVNAYGETMPIMAGETVTLSSRHASLRFSPLPKPIDKAGFLITSRFDATSFGGGEGVRYAIVLLPKKGAPPELKFIQPEQGFDPALPPTDPTFQKILKLISDADALAR